MFTILKEVSDESFVSERYTWRQAINFGRFFFSRNVLFLHVWLIDILVLASVIPTRNIITDLLGIIVK